MAHASLSAADVLILEDVARFSHYTARQLSRLRYPRLDTAQQKLKDLADAGYLRWQMLGKPAPSVTVKQPYVYSLDTRGVRYLRSLGKEAERLPQKEYHYPTMAHRLACIDALIECYLLGLEPGICLEQAITERDWQRSPATVTVDGSAAKVLPDGSARFRVGNEPQHVFFEVDRDTEEQPFWQRKIHRLLAYAEGPFVQVRGPELIMFAVVVLPGDPAREQRRLRELVAWTEGMLRSVGNVVPTADGGTRSRGDLFFFTTTPPGSVPARSFFFEGWSVPFRDGAFPLLEVPG